MTAPRGVDKAFDREAVEARTGGEPDWLADLRRRAWDVYEETPFPTTKLEEWRYTEVSQLKLDEVRLEDLEAGAERSVPDPARAMVEGRRSSGHVIQIGGSIVELESGEELRDKGVILTDLATAAREHRDLVEEHLATRAVPAESGKFAALNGALWSAGVFLYVPPGVRVEAPIRVARWIDEAGVAVLPRTLIIADEGSQIAYVDEFGSPDFDEPTLSCDAVEVFAERNAQVQYVALQRWGRGVRHVSSQKTIAQRDADLDTLVVNLGATVARVDLAALLEGAGANSDMLGLYFGGEDQHFDHNTRQDHVAAHATSDLLYKGALYDQARAIFRGVIQVHEGAQQTDAYQTNRNLLLSRDARADSLPNLEIEADDVRCSHGATVGQLNEEEIFYLRSRGLSREQAERIVVFGFLGEVLDRLPLPGVVDEVRTAIAQRIG